MKKNMAVIIVTLIFLIIVSIPLKAQPLIVNGQLDVNAPGQHTKIVLNSNGALVDNWISSYDENGNRMWIINMGDRSQQQGNADRFGIWSETTQSWVFNIRKADGHVSIGTDGGSSYMFQVCGNMRAEEVRVQTGWCDYVFNDNYELRSLQDVKAFIKQNKHLPDVTPGNIIEKEGLQLGETSSQMIKKIEENTLYLIQHDEQLENFIVRLEKLEKENSDLKKAISDLKKHKGGAK